MGINDRDYGRYGNGDQYGYNDQPGFHFGGVQSMTIKVVIVTVLVYIIQLMAGPWFEELFEVHAGWYREPWRVFELLTYGFLHNPRDLSHILLNMLVFWFFGRTIEERYGKKEFLTFYLSAIVFSGLVWCIATWIEYRGDFNGLGPTALGASGGVSAVILLFALNWPDATISLFGVFPMKAWVAGLIWVAKDVIGALNPELGDSIGYSAHAGGFLFAYLYHKFHWNLSYYLPSKMPSFKRKPPLKVHRPSDDERKEDRLDYLLGKVATGGQESLSSSEKRELQRLSKYYQDKRK